MNYIYEPFPREFFTHRQRVNLDRVYQDLLNHTQANIASFEEIGHALNFPTEAIQAWFCTRIPATSERPIIMNEHDEYRFQRLLDEFIERYVRCSYCHRQETLIYATNDGKLKASCKGNKCNKEKELSLNDEINEIYFIYCSVETPMPIRIPKPDPMIIPQP